jgi:hypothetical protein
VIELRIDLAEQGFPGQFVELADIGVMSPKQLASVAGDNVDSREFLSIVVTSWNVLDPVTGSHLPEPGAEALDVNDIPLRIVKLISENVRQQLEDLSPLGPRKA